MTIIPYLLTFLIGILGLKALTRNNKTLSAPLFLCVACLIGIAESIFICFFSFIFLNRFHQPFIVGMHVLEIIFLLIITRKTLNIKEWRDIISIRNLDFISILIFCGIISTLFAKTYPYGGWDAWQVWNFKAKFLLLSGDQWKDLFHPALWRSSPHYPLALPLFNAWTWSFSKNTPVIIPLVNTVIFNILTGGLMFSAVTHFTKNKWSYIPVIMLFLIPSYMVLSSSQYCDVFLGLYFLGSVITLYEAQRSRSQELFVIAAIFLGLLSFTKPEGSILAGLTFLAAHFSILHQQKDREKTILFWISMFIACIPMLLFLIFLSPGNQTFVNGLFSITPTSTFLRFKIILAYLFAELGSIKWGFLWLIILAAMILNFGKVFRKSMRIFYFPLLSYFIIILLYYWINTHFDILWWLNVSLSRILSSLLPAVIVWMTIGVCSKKVETSRRNVSTE